MDRKKITYGELKSRQKQDIKSGSARYFMFRHVSTPFTWIFVKLGISPSTITISNSILCLFGFYFLSLGTYPPILAGLLFFLFFDIIDMTDGEVARIQNKTSIEGEYFDRLSHYIFACCFGLGLGLGIYKLYQSEIYLILGFLFTSLIVVENAKGNLLNSLLRESIINREIYNKKIPGEKPDKYFQKKMTNCVHDSRSWAQGNIISRVIGIYPFPGLIYTDQFIITPLLFILTIIEYTFNTLIGFPPYIIGLIPLYLIIISTVKIINITIFLIKLKRKMYITKMIQKMENKED